MSGTQAKHQRKLPMQLTAIDSAQEIEDINLPSFKLHPLTGNQIIKKSPREAGFEIRSYR